MAASTRKRVVDREMARQLVPDQDMQGLLTRLRDEDSAVAEHAARALRKISQGDRSSLIAVRKDLLREALRARDLRVQWNLTIVLGRLPFVGRDRALAVEWIFERLGHSSALMRTFAMQALVDLSEHDPGLRARALLVVREFALHGTAAMRARARKLLQQIA